MKQYRFAGDQRRMPAPGFRLMSGGGQAVALTDYRDRANLILFFPNGTENEALKQTLRHFQARRNDYAAHAARVVAVVDAPAQEVADLDQELEASSLTLLADPEGATRQEYAALLPDEPGTEAALFFVLDRFGAPHVAFASSEPQNSELHDNLIDWLFGIELECPE